MKVVKCIRVSNTTYLNKNPLTLDKTYIAYKITPSMIKVKCDNGLMREYMSNRFEITGDYFNTLNLKIL